MQSNGLWSSHAMTGRLRVTPRQVEMTHVTASNVAAMSSDEKDAFLAIVNHERIRENTNLGTKLVELEDEAELTVVNTFSSPCLVWTHYPYLEA